LAQCLESYKNAQTNLLFPRCHFIRTEADSDAFVEDYITTALVSTLKIIVKAIENSKKIFDANGNVSQFIVTLLYKNHEIVFLIAKLDTIQHYSFRETMYTTFFE